MLRVSSVHCTSAVQEFLQTSRCTIAVNACQVSEAAEGSQGRLLLHIEWPTVANTTVYLLEMDLTSLETDFILPEMDFNSPEMDFTSLETDFTSPETDFTFFIFEVHFRWVKSIFNGYLQMDLTFSKHSNFDRLHPSEVYYLSNFYSRGHTIISVKQLKCGFAYGGPIGGTKLVHWVRLPITTWCFIHKLGLYEKS